MESLVSVKKKHFEKIFVVDGVSLAKLKRDFRKIFVKASSSQNLENSGFCPIFHPNLSHIYTHNFWHINLENFSEKIQIVQFIADNLKKFETKRLITHWNLAPFAKEGIMTFY